ncbi:MAG: chromate transporter [Kiritimatiellales bacterium]
MMLLNLYWVFFKIGLFTIGGGLASLPLLQAAVVESGMISQTEFIDMLAISQSTPGPIGINMATFAGYKLAGIAGGFIATLGIVSPSLIIIMAIAAWMRNFAAHPVVKGIMGGIRPAALGLIASAAWFILQKALVFAETASVSIPALLLFAGLALAYRLRPASPILYILAGGAIGLLVF